MARLDPAQRRAVEQVRGPLLVDAGPGTGKTRVVTERIANQVRAGAASPSQILAVTFTDKAAREMAGRLQALGVSAGGREGVRAATFHSAALSQTRAFWPRVSGGEAPEVLSSKVGTLLPLLSRAGQLRSVAVADVAAEIEWVKAQGAGAVARLDLSGPVPRWRIEPGRYAAALERHDGPWPAEPGSAAVVASFAELFDAYEAAKAVGGRLDFEDMLAVASALVGSDVEVGRAVRGRYTHITIDEFQDTNRLQWDLLLAWAGDRDDVCVVGDADQAIYGFTGASPRYLAAFRARFPSAAVVRLQTNHRSTQAICDTAAAVLRGRPLRATAPAGAAPLLAGHDDEEGERAYVVDRCRELRSSGVGWDEMAVLYRFNAQSEAWETAFADAGIAYRVAGDPGYFGRRHVTRALTVLDSAARSGAGDPDPHDPLVVLDGVPPKQDPLERVVARVLRQRMSWTDREPEGETARERWRDLAVLVDLAARLGAERPDAGLDGFLAEMRRRAAAGSEPGGGGVSLLTLHRAKGLEFDAVFVVSAEEGRLPSRHAVEHDRRLRLSERDPDSAVAEERRLLYVGLTRARLHLHVTWVERGRKRPSRFLRDLARRGRGLRVGSGGRPPARTPVPEPSPLSPDAVAVFETLRDWRLQRARSDGVPAYVVFPDVTLREIARTRPETREQLLSVSGIGPGRLARYGDDVLALLRDSSSP